MLCELLTFISAVLILCLILKLFYFEKQFINDVQNRAVFVTGADSGFGYLLAVKLAKSGSPVFAGCFTTQGISNIERDTQDYSGEVKGIQIDISNQDSVNNAVNTIKEAIKVKGYEGLWGVVNNAAVPGLHGPDDWFNVGDYQHCLDVNTLGTISVIHAVKPLIKKCHGRIVITSSLAGRLCHPNVGPYTVSKYAMEGYADCLRLDMKQFNVKVIVIQPGPFTTNIMNIDAMNDRIDLAWRRADDYVAQEEYGKEYLEELKLAMTALNKMTASSKIEIPVEDMYSALFCKYPRSRYQCGAFAKYVATPVSLLPAGIMDLFLYDIPKYTPTARPLPKCFKSKKQE